ncbi:beta-galactosidase [Polaromonas hydrogenivorans]|uniref:Beta-galactosidase n=1 Tax=Polaromonas hydrogenivorans TaxID=335476 RepID=A0AAU7LUE9_9BURK
MSALARRFARGLGLLLLPTLLCVTPVVALAQADTWLPMRERALAIAAGSALDFSAFVEPGPAGRHGWAQVLPDGHIGFEKRRSAQRFFAASLVLGGLNGGFPDHSGADRLVEQLQRTGYNLVRLHFVDAQMMTGRNKDFDFNPEQLDRLQYLLASLARGGVYWLADGITSDNAAWGDVKPHRWVKKYSAKLDVLTTEAGFQHWATLVQRLWGARNPYTGTAPLNDPAMLGLILVNEGSLGYLATIAGDRYPLKLEPLFRDWLRNRYGSDKALQAAWATELRRDESLATQVKLPVSVRGRSVRDTDFARFVVELERKAYRRMEAHVRGLGFGGLTTAFDNWGFVNADITRAALPWVDMHAYHASPSNHGQPGSRIAQTSIHSNVARYVRELMNTRQWGKPFTVSEYGQPFWNRWRHESAALVPAVAALQDWDAICLFAETPIQDNYGTSPFIRRQAIYPYGVGADPITRAGERLAALLFLRGDVAPARGRIRLHVNAERALARSGGWEQVPEGLSRLGLVSAIGLDFSPMPAKPVKGELAVDLTGARPVWWSRLENSLIKSGADTLAPGIGPLREAGIVGANNLSRPQDKLYQSDTGQVTVDSASGLITVDSERSAVLVLRDGVTATAGPLEVSGGSGPALVALSSLDLQPIGSSRRLLLWVLTDAINSGMTFDDAERTTIRTLGRFPPMVRPLAATIQIEHASASRLRVWPLSLNGERRTQINLKVNGNVAQLHLDTAALPDGPALFFEIAVE